jgi:hypothetical protein
MELQACRITIDTQAITAPGWLEVSDADDPRLWELTVRGPIDGDLGGATNDKTEDVFRAELTISQGRRYGGEGQIRKATDSLATGMRSLVMAGNGPLRALS